MRAALTVLDLIRGLVLKTPKSIRFQTTPYCPITPPADIRELELLQMAQFERIKPS